MQLYSNYAQTYLAAGINDTVTTFNVTATDGGLFHAPIGDEFELVVLTDGTYWEVVKVTGRVNDTFTVERGYEGVARAWLINTRVKSTITEDTLARFLQREQVGATLNVFAYQNFR